MIAILTREAPLIFKALEHNKVEWDGTFLEGKGVKPFLGLIQVFSGLLLVLIFLEIRSPGNVDWFLWLSLVLLLYFALKVKKKKFDFFFDFFSFFFLYVSQILP